MAEPKKKITSADFRATVAEILIEQLEQGVAPWQKPWNTGAIMPQNPVTALTNKDSRGYYRGINRLWLPAVATVEGFKDNRWVTFLQATSMHYGSMKPLTQKELELNRTLPYGHADRIPTWSIMKGSKATHAEKWGRYTPKGDKAGKAPPSTDEIQSGDTSRMFFTAIPIFNGDQVDGIPPYVNPIISLDDAARFALADKAVAAMGVRVVDGTACSYNPLSDQITMVPIRAFKDPADWYATRFHEYGHASGHSTRLNREGITGNHPFGSEVYAAEELRAEIASMLMSHDTGIRYDSSRHAAYVGSWIKKLKSDPNEIFKATKDASAMADFVLGDTYKLALAELDALEDVKVEDVKLARGPSLAYAGGM